MKKDKIYKIFSGKYIDLSKIISISDAYFIDRMGRGGWFVGFEIYCQLLESPIKYIRPLNKDEHSYILEEGIYSLFMEDGSKVHENSPEFYTKDTAKILGVINLQKQINELIIAWREVANEE